MPQRPPHRPAPPPLPDLTTYRPYDERPHGAPPPHAYPAHQQPAHQPPRHGAPRRRRKSSALRIAAWTLGGIVVLIGAGVVALVAFAPVDMLRDQLAREIEVRTGRELKVAGRTSLSFYPSLGLSLEKVTLSGPPEMGGAPFLKAPRLELQAALWPLIERRLVLERLVLTDAELELRVDARGRQSWDFANLMPPPTIMVAQAGGKTGEMPPELQDFLRNATKSPATPAPVSPASTAPATSPAKSAASIPDMTLGDVRLVNATVRYRDERSGTAEEVRAINARLSAKSLASPLDADGDLSLRGERVSFKARVAAPRALLEQRPTKVSLAVTAPSARFDYDGALSVAKGTTLDGALKLQSPSVRALARWLAIPLQPGEGLAGLSLSGDLKTGPNWVSIDNARARLDAIDAEGNARVDFGSNRPRLKGTIRLGALDLNPYLADATPQPPTQPMRGTAGANPAPAPAPRTSPPSPGPQVRGFTKRSGWSDAPIDLAPLGMLDADLRLALAGLVYRDVKLGATRGGFTLERGALRATIEDMRLYGGQGRATATLEPSVKGTASVGINLTVDGVSGLPLLKDAAGFDWIDGRGRVALAIAGAGASEQAIVETLNGKADFVFTNGAIIGFDFPEMIRGLTQGRIGRLERSPNARTAFSEAGASFQIRNGIAETNDLRAISPAVRVTGTGTVSLGPRQIDVVLRPRLGGGSQPSANVGGLDLSKLDVPINVKGSWERPSITPDLGGVLKGNAETFRELGRQLQQGRTDGIRNLIDQFRPR
jgi:AsmA protein